MGRRAAQKRQRREALEAAGLECFLEEGYDRASIEQIVRQAGVARGTFYLYFPDKFSLFEALMDRWFEPLLGTLKDVEGQLALTRSKIACLRLYEQLGVALTVVGLANRDEILLAFRENRRPGALGERLRERELSLMDQVTRLTELAVERGLIHVAEPRLASLLIIGAVERLYYEVLIDADLGAPVPQVARGAVRMLARALGLPVEEPVSGEG